MIIDLLKGTTWTKLGISVKCPDLNSDCLVVPRPFILTRVKRVKEEPAHYELTVKTSTPWIYIQGWKCS